jgi:hypothetical protein
MKLGPSTLILEGQFDPKQVDAIFLPFRSRPRITNSFILLAGKNLQLVIYLFLDFDIKFGFKSIILAQMTFNF